jgi:ketosteroid isomerase-like protein
MDDERIARLIDERDIVAVTLRYGWALDTKDYERLREVFLPDATADLTEPCNGVDAIIERVRGALDPLDRSQHVITNHDVVVDGDQATCRSQLVSQHVRKAAEGGRNYVVGGVYTDRLERTAAGWRIRHRDLTVTWTDGNRRVVRP